MSEPNFNQDLELFKLTQVAEEWRNDYLAGAGFYISALIAVLIFALTYSLNYRPWDNLVAFLILALPAALIFTGLIWFRVSVPYKKRLAHLNGLIKKVQSGNSVPDLEELLRPKKSHLRSKIRSLYKGAKKLSPLLAILNVVTIGYAITNVYYGSDMNSVSIHCISANTRTIPYGVDWSKVDMTIGLNRSISPIAGLFESIWTSWRITVLLDLPNQEWLYVNASSPPVTLGPYSRFNMTFDSTEFLLNQNITIDSIALTDTYSSGNVFFPLGVVHVNSKYVNLSVPYNRTTIAPRMLKLRQILIQNVLLLSGLPIETIPHACYGLY
jgi:hypothetical protein